MQNYQIFYAIASGYQYYKLVVELLVNFKSHKKNAARYENSIVFFLISSNKSYSQQIISHVGGVSSSAAAERGNRDPGADDAQCSTGADTVPRRLTSCAQHTGTVARERGNCSRISKLIF